MKSTLFLAIGALAGAALATLAHRPLIRSLEIDPTYQILTRAAADRRLSRRRRGFDLVLLDIDQMKALNTQYGYDEINRRIRAALGTVPLRRGDLLWRHFSGDEFGAAVDTGAGAAIKARIVRALAGEGLTACVHVEPVRDVASALVQAERAVLTLKAERPALLEAAHG